MNSQFECWACGREAPAGVCLGPHPEWERHPDAAMICAIDRGHVERLDDFLPLTPERRAPRPRKAR